MNSFTAGTGITLTGCNTVTGGSTGTATFSNSPSSPPPPRFPPSWKHYATKGNPAYGGDHQTAETPVTGKQLWIGNISVLNTKGRFHYDLFCKLHPDVESVVIAMCEGNAGTPSNVAFYNETDWLKFYDWIMARVDLFGGYENLYSYNFPPLPLELGSSINIPRLDDEQLSTIAAWLIENCKFPVYHSGDHYVFTNPDDAFLYKLKFKKPDTLT